MTRIQAIGFWAGIFLAFVLIGAYFMVSVYQYQHFGCLPWELCS